MAVSIDVYRSRIGQFGNSKLGRRKKYNSSSNPKVQTRSSIISIILAIATIIAISLVAPSNCYSNNSYYKPRNLHQTKPAMYLPLSPPLTVSHTELSQLSSQKFQYPFQPPPPANNNFLARYKFGNRGRKKNGITIMHWNKGSSFLINKKDDIETVIENYKPQVLGLSEANLRHGDNVDDVQLQDYNLHLCPTIDNPVHGVSRVVVYTHKSLIVKPRPDLMDPRISAVWLEVGLPGRHKFLICNTYREWGYPNQPDRSTHTIPAQKDRWSLFLDKWEAAIIEDKEILVLGDINSAK